MIRKLLLTVVLCFVLALLAPQLVQAQTVNLVGHLTVTKPGVAVQRANTSTFIAVATESLIGAGDSIRTDKDGTATLSFDQDVIVLKMSPSSETAIAKFEQTSDGFDLQIRVKNGLTEQTSLRSLDTKSSSLLLLPAFSVQMLEGTSQARVEASGRSALLIAATGHVTVDSGDHKAVDIPAKSGVRQAVGEAISDVVPATTFPILDAAIDGCPSHVVLEGDVRLNVRLGASLNFPKIGELDSNSDIQAMGIAATGGWYRIRYSGGYGWITLPTLPLDKSCAGLRPFAAKYGPEDVSLYTPPIDLPTPTPAATSVATAAATASK
jgi:hypothetical protein